MSTITNTAGRHLDHGLSAMLARWEGSNLAYDQNGPRQILVDWISGTGKTSTAFDFPTKGILQVRNLHSHK